MNKLTQQEFQDRVEAVANARKIFINLTGGNITNAFTLYQEVLAEKTREIWIDSVVHGHRHPSPLDGYDRPKCPDCGNDLMFRPINDPTQIHKVMLDCENPECNTRLYSENDLNWWMEEMRNELKRAQERK